MKLEPIHICIGFFMVKRSLILTLAILFLSKWTLGMFLLNDGSEVDLFHNTHIKKETSSHAQIEKSFLAFENENIDEESEESEDSVLNFPIYFNFDFSYKACKEAYYYATFGHLKIARIYLRNRNLRN